MATATKVTEKPVLIENNNGPGDVTLLCGSGWHKVGRGQTVLYCRAHDAFLAELNRTHGDSGFKVRIAKSAADVPDDFTPAENTSVSIPNTPSGKAGINSPRFMRSLDPSILSEDDTTEGVKEADTDA